MLRVAQPLSRFRYNLSDVYRTADIDDNRLSYDSHVENLKSPRGYFLISTWRRIISSEVLVFLHVEIVSRPRGEFSFSTWGFENFHVGIGKFRD